MFGKKRAPYPPSSHIIPKDYGVLLRKSESCSWLFSTFQMIDLLDGAFELVLCGCTFASPQEMASFQAENRECLNRRQAIFEAELGYCSSIPWYQNFPAFPPQNFYEMVPDPEHNQTRMRVKGATNSKGKTLHVLAILGPQMTEEQLENLIGLCSSWRARVSEWVVESEGLGELKWVFSTVDRIGFEFSIEGCSQRVLNALVAEMDFFSRNVHLIKEVQFR